jgi:hypothetical protein
MLAGKGFYLWKIPLTEGGNAEAIAGAAAQAGLSHVLIKIADGGYKYNYDYQNKIDHVPPVAQALRARGVAPWGWHYVRGDNPTAEAKVAVERVQALGLDGYVIDAEAEYKGRFRQAATFMSLLRRDLPNTTIALSSYRYPSYHPTLPWKQFLDQCNLNMPQVYWQGSTNPAAQLQRTLNEFNAMSPQRPIMPTGAAYAEHNWQPTPAQIIEFLDEARRQNLSAANFWEWTAARALGYWDVIGQYSWGGPTPPPAPPPQIQPPPGIAHLYIAALNTRRPDQVIQLYKPDAVHVSAARTAQGVGEIIGYYAELLVARLPQATFRLTAASVSGNTSRINWTAASSAGSVSDGNDFIALFDGKIGFHSTSFTIQ